MSFSGKVSEIKLSYKSKVKAAERPQIRSSSDAFRLLLDQWDADEIDYREHFKVLLLDRSNRVVAIYTVSIGGMAGTVVDAKVVFIAALKVRATSIILAHNHPSGNVQPSSADVQLTNKLTEGGKLLDIQVLDHLIITSQGYYSFADEGLL